MVQLDRSMMERYEIPDRRPAALRAAIFGADQMMLGVAARLLDRANELGEDLGAVCITRAAGQLQAQDGMFTLLVRGDNEDGSHTSREHVVQSIIAAALPDNALNYAAEPALGLIFISSNFTAADCLLAARFLHARFTAGLNAPMVLLTAEHPQAGLAGDLRAALKVLSAEWENAGAFHAWLDGACFQSLLAESLSGRLGEAEAAKARHDMNYRDDFIAWAEPQMKCTPELQAPECLAKVLDAGDFADALAKKQRIFDSAVFICAAAGFLSGMDSFAQVLKDEKLRAWIGRAFFDEILPRLPWSREEVTPHVISAFTRLENSMNDMPLLETGWGMMRNFSDTLLPAIRAHADAEFEAPLRLSLALSAAIMVYAGARRNESGLYEVARGDRHYILRDDADCLEAFSSLAHDMPAETLAYAVLADRSVWGTDLREIDGLEMRVAFNLSSIQRVGFRETLRLQEEEK